MRRLYFILPCLLLALCTYAAGLKQGVVVDSENQPLIGVSVIYGGTTVITDFDGVFTIDVEENTELTFSFIGYQTATKAAQDGMVVVLKKKGEDAEGWRMFIMANGAYAPQQQTMGGLSGYGFTLGMFKTAGWYASFMMGPQIKFPKYGDSKNANDYLYTGNMRVSRWSGTVGFLAGKMAYFYGGVGYGRRSLLCEAYNIDGQVAYWIPEQSRTSILNGMMWECGILADIKGFGLSVGADCLTDFNNTAFWEIKVGLGGCFNVKGAKK